MGFNYKHKVDAVGKGIKDSQAFMSRQVEYRYCALAGVIAGI